MKTTSLLAIALILAGTGLALPAADRPTERTRPGFDPTGMVRNLHHHRGAPSLPPRDGGLSFDDGEFLLDTCLAYGPAAGNQRYPAVGFDGSNFLMVWADERSGFSDIYGARVTPAGTVLDPTGIPIATGAYDQSGPAVGFDGSNFLVVWENSPGNRLDIYGARVSPAGEVLDPDGIPIAAGGYQQLSPAVAFDGSTYLVVWNDRRSGPGIYGARVTPAGTVLDPDGIPVATGYWQAFPAVGFDGFNFLLVWADGRNGFSDIYGARVSPAGVVLDPDGIPIATTEYDQTRPGVEFDGSNFLVVWEDGRGWPGDVYGARVTPAGTVLDPDGISIAAGPYGQSDPAVGFDGSNFLVVWADDRAGRPRRDIYGARVTPAGTVLDPDGIPIAVDMCRQWSPAVGSDGSHSFVAWQDERAGWPQLDIYGARVTPAGTVLDPDGIRIATGGYWQAYPAVGFDGLNFLLVWADGRNGFSDIYGARVTPAGEVLDPDGVSIAAGSYGQSDPAVAFDGANFLVVWTDGRDGELGIYGARVTPVGTVLDPDGIPITTGAYPRWRPFVAFDGSCFLVVWGDSRAGGWPDIYGARVSPAGEVLDPDGIPIATGAYWQGHPAVGFDGAHFLVAWEDARAGWPQLDIYGARVSPAGAVLDPDGIEIATGAYWREVPAVGFDGSSFLVVWEDRRSGPCDIYGARVSPTGEVLDPDGIRIAVGTRRQQNPAVGFDGSSFLVVWEDYLRGFPDIYGARVTPAGTVFDQGPVVRQLGSQLRPALTHGPGDQPFLAYEGWVGMYGGQTYSTRRTWGKLDPSPGVAEERRQEPIADRPQPMPTIVRGSLSLPRMTDDQLPMVLLDVSGRKVMELQPGENDVRHLSPGVYFVRAEGLRGQGVEGSSRKVVIQR